MSVASKNPFALLDEENASRAASPAPTSAPKQAAPAPTAPTRGAQRGRSGPASRGGRYYQRGGKPTASRENQAAEEPAAEGEAPKKRFEGEGRGRGRGRGRGDRGRGGRGRPFDKHSQTGRVDTDKKVSQGWGADEGNAELKAEDAAAGDAAAEAFNPPADTSGWGATDPSADAWGASTPAEDAAAAAVEGDKSGEREGRKPRDVEEEDNTLTLDEYLKQKKQQELELIPKLEVRKANEGDDSIWKDAVVVNKKDEDEAAYFVGKTKTSAPKSRPKKEEKVYLEIDARFERPSRGGRGGRGGDRGGRGRGRGGNRGRANGSASAPVIDVDDQTAFPSLS
ncbi:hypothetical protein WOLCODRAFT_22099 [Wolfiporia cocos MD-104 SS10]|uniref:Hyaluronan/mRNA-binding protein domain-containing protein n=1 Tax=Wolfiporia cocos (strain MD-104) TaxID=742152 RepID=A0A2H3J7H4_WOLCO|nr:hypothetical protein WOLCODRAFT_22099 [Wolfiporia cocos MD-104 SS10]